MKTQLISLSALAIAASMMVSCSDDTFTHTDVTPIMASDMNDAVATDLYNGTSATEQSSIWIEQSGHVSVDRPDCAQDPLNSAYGQEEREQLDCLGTISVNGAIYGLSDPYGHIRSTVEMEYNTATGAVLATINVELVSQDEMLQLQARGSTQEDLGDKSMKLRCISTNAIDGAYFSGIVEIENFTLLRTSTIQPELQFRITGDFE